LSLEGDQWTASLSITVRDHVSTVLVPLSLTMDSDSLTASGEFDLTHSQLGLTPYSVGLGAIRVAENMHVRFRVLARRVQDSGGADHP